LIIVAAVPPGTAATLPEFRLLPFDDCYRKLGAENEHNGKETRFS
jgi:hypothetical protein